MRRMSKPRRPGRRRARRRGRNPRALPLDLSEPMGLFLQGERPIAVKAGMPRALKMSVGQFSDKGRKEINQDFHGVLIPDEPLLSLKGIAIVLADGISTSKVSQIA